MIYRDDINGLRAIAVLAIMLFHTQNDYFTRGFIGVDLFFIVSGYLITALITTAQYQQHFSLSGFYIKRARRLLPALILVMFACIPFAWFWMFSNQYNDFSQSLVAASVFASNVLFWLESQLYFTNSNSLKPLLHTWSLAIEVQFYLVYPLLLVFLLSNLKRYTIEAIFFLTVVFALYSVLKIDSPLTLHYLPQARMWLFGVGALAYFARDKWSLGHGKYSGYVAILGSLLLLSAFVIHEPFESTHCRLVSHLLWPYMAIIGFTTLLVFSDPSNAIGRFLAMPLLSGIGLISYSAYLWHYPIFTFAHLRFLNLSFDVYLYLSLLSLGVAYLSWRYIEAPFRDDQKITNRPFLVGVIFALLLLVVVGLYGVSQHGYVIGMSDNDTILNQATGLDLKCGLEAGQAKCRVGDNPQMLVWGDSFAMHSVNVVLANNPEMSIVQLTLSACSPFQSDINYRTGAVLTDASSLRCLDFNKKVMASLRQWPSLKYVVISSRFSNNFLKKSDTANNQKERERGFTDTFNRLSIVLQKVRSQGLIPIVISEPRRPPEEKSRCAAHTIKFNGDSDMCTYPSSIISEPQQMAARLLKRIGINYRIIWLDDYLCPGTHCITVDGNTALYATKGHLSDRGGALIGTKLKVHQQITSSSK